MNRGNYEIDPITGRNDDDHYFLSEEEIVAQRKNKVEVDFNGFKKTKEELFLKYQNYDVFGLSAKIENYLKSFVDGVSREMGMNIHDVNNDRHTILISTEFLKDRGFEGNLSDLKNFPSRGGFFLDEFLTILAKYKL